MTSKWNVLWIFHLSFTQHFKGGVSQAVVKYLDLTYVLPLTVEMILLSMSPSPFLLLDWIILSVSPLISYCSNFDASAASRMFADSLLHSNLSSADDVIFYFCFLLLYLDSLRCPNSKCVVQQHSKPWSIPSFTFTKSNMLPSTSNIKFLRKNTFKKVC